jgi:hypothetical protein
MYPHGRRTCYQYASSFFTLSWFYPVGEMDSPLEPHTMTFTGTNPLPVGWAPLIRSIIQQIGCSYHPQKGMPGNVGFQMAFSVNTNQTCKYGHREKVNRNGNGLGTQTYQKTHGDRSGSACSTSSGKVSNMLLCFSVHERYNWKRRRRRRKHY